MTITHKDLKKKKNHLGQFMTPDTISRDMVEHTEYKGLIIEPSFGLGSFLYKLEKKYPTVIGVEFDPQLFSQYCGSSVVFNQSFYRFELPNNLSTEYISFVGNPPYRTPAASLTSDDKDVILSLCKKYAISGIKEEAVFFIAYAVDIILRAGVPGMIHWILPKTIFENNSKAFKSFRKFLAEYAPITEIVDITEKYPEVAQPLCIVKFLVNQPSIIDLSNSIVLRDTIEFQSIFKKTYLGSVPCESILLSCKNEPLDSFKSRLEKIFQCGTSIVDGLKFDGEYHLRALRGESAAEKFKILDQYVAEISALIDVNAFSDQENYKIIAHRNEVRWYFRHRSLLKASFIYKLNPNPTKSFYFPGNPSKSSTDYFGFCDYDCNRNSSPGANRTVPVENIKDNITDEFTRYWESNTTEPISEIFDYILYISKSVWYKEYKSKFQRFYFGLPKQFDQTWRASSNKEIKHWDDITAGTIFGSSSVHKPTTLKKKKATVINNPSLFIEE